MREAESRQPGHGSGSLFCLAAEAAAGAQMSARPYTLSHRWGPIRRPQVPFLMRCILRPQYARVELTPPLDGPGRIRTR
ncbi:hypothetical protein STAFG_7010 [Streptomyces afghaniensis 772]|uniref:Uncharacterized protein n=1 Tax=Streptomyces afghaniensis 772 TaxID=1283301 RepID=S4MK18_9ACTN|nr:hypothetical protein STAFG_7010 [Streptomyces afghaniensis 772]